MSSYPPPPQPDQQHYNPIYDGSGNSQPLLDPEQQEQLHLATLAHATDYPKVEHTGLDPTTSSQLEQRFEQFQHQQSLENSQLQHHALPAPNQGEVPSEDLVGIPTANGTPNKLFRLRKACDSCSIRKVKCDESGPPCKACAALDIPCTFDRPSRRRGPPNRHAEAVKRRRLDEEQGGSPSQARPPSPTHAAQALAALSSHPSTQSGLSVESIMPIEAIDLLINDYFTYIHPLAPFPHEPSFREAWRRREDLANRPFLALIASMIAALVASCPKKALAHLDAQHNARLFSSSSELVRTCFKVCDEARGPGYVRSENLTVHDAATSYLLGLAAARSGHVMASSSSLGECFTIITTLLQASEGTRLEGSSLDGIPLQPEDTTSMHDHITLQVGRRVFWTAFVSARWIQVLGLPGAVHLPVADKYTPYPPLPLEVEDYCIFPTHIESQPSGLIPTLAGFNANVRALTTCAPILQLRENDDVDQKRSTYRECALRITSLIDQLPEELRLVSGDGEAAEAADAFAAFQLKMGLRDANLLSIDESSAEQRRITQRAIQKAAIYTSYLAVLSFIVEDHRAARLPVAEAEDEDNFSTERDSLIRNLLTVLATLDQEHMEPDGRTMFSKIRFVASAAVELPQESKTSLAIAADGHLRTFLDIVSRLARADSDSEGQLWAELRNIQGRFADSGGVAQLV